MMFIFVSEPTYEVWNWRNPDTKGIGGSETSHIEMSRRLARRGHTVISYAPTFAPREVDDAGVEWRDFQELDYSLKGTWIVYRAPKIVDRIPEDQTVWHICQDVSYPDFYDGRISRFSRVVALCNEHAAFLREQFPEAAHRIVISANGIKSELIAELAKRPPKRNAKRLIYASSPDRGLTTLITIFQRAREIVHDLELHVFYGFNNLEKIARTPHPRRQMVVQNVKMIKEMLQSPGIHVHGRTAQPKLLREWMKSGIWCHPSDFTETSCITSMDAQACGAIPITRPFWAIGENVKHGILMHGETWDSLVRARYVWEIVKLASDPELQSQIRGEMMPWALEHFNWKNVVDQWEDWAREDIRVAQAAQMVPCEVCV
jgi:glycosyltransferase involved in cell wall biosynthesis